jgi:formylglycine-generating enzyme required for sulfatase activity
MPLGSILICPGPPVTIRPGVRGRWCRRLSSVYGALTVSILLVGMGVPAAQLPTRLAIERVVGTNDTVELNFRVSAGTYYRLQGSPELLAWKTKQTGVACTELVKLGIEVSATSSVFYRLQIIPVEPLESMVWIEPGEFMLSSPPDEVGRFLDKEDPETHVHLTRGYWISRYEVTQGEFETVMSFNPSLFRGDAYRPVEDVSWHDAVRYCGLLTERERAAGRLPEVLEYRLPTESQWAYAARAGTTTRFSYGDDPGYQHLTEYAWYGGNSGLRPHPVGQKLPNPWGLYDMHGNVFEWCLDWFGPLPGGFVIDPQGPESGTDRIVRGGYWDSAPAFCRSATRVHYPPSNRISYLGFRIVLAETADQ